MACVGSSARAGAQVRLGLVGFACEVEENAEVGLGVEIAGVGSGGSGELGAGGAGLVRLEVLVSLLQVLGGGGSLGAEVRR